MDPNIVVFRYPSTSKGLKCYKYSCLIYSIIEISFIGLSASSALFLQFEVCITSISFQASIILATLWMIYKSTFQSIKICLYLSPIVLLGTIILYPLLKTWAEASKALCSDVISYSSNTKVVANCKSLILARSTLELILMVELGFRSFWLIACFAGYRFKISLNILVAQIREARRLERAEEMRQAKERERRRKERRRMELKDKILNKEI